jgi:aspartate racemase
MRARDEAGAELAATALRLERAGAEAILICTNTMHKVAGRVAEAVAVPLLHIADCTAERLAASHVATVALLGTKFTMEEDFYRSRLEARGLEVLVPEAEGRAEVNRVIYEELCQGRVLDTSRERYRREIEALAEQGAQAAILGCTEIGMLIGDGDVSIPTFDTTRIHAEAAAEFLVG